MGQKGTKGQNARQVDANKKEGRSPLVTGSPFNTLDNGMVIRNRYSYNILALPLEATQGESQQYTAVQK